MASSPRHDRISGILRLRQGQETDTVAVRAKRKPFGKAAGHGNLCLFKGGDLSLCGSASGGFSVPRHDLPIPQHVPSSSLRTNLLQEGPGKAYVGFYSLRQVSVWPLQ